jgi:hypothetical protein
MFVLYNKEKRQKAKSQDNQDKVRRKYTRTKKKKNPDGARFSAPVQTGAGVKPAYYTMCTGSLSQE